MILDNYKEYRENKPDYKEWENQRLAQEAKRVNYLKKNNINASNSKTDIERAKNILNAVDVMDEFSQSRAEEMEMTVQTAKIGTAELLSMAGLGLAALSIKCSKNICNACENLLGKGHKFSPLVLIPAALYALPTLGATTVLSIFGARQETKASRLGRAEAINKKLNSPKQFAVLTEEQKKQVEEEVKSINISDDEVKKRNKTTRGLGIFKSIKTMFAGDKENEAKLQELKEEANKHTENINSGKVLTPEQIEEAKKDKQLVQNVVHKIDIASQEYAEDVELATGTFQLLALSSGGLVGGLTKFLLGKTKLPENKVNKISMGIGVVLGIAGSIWATTLQKQASRVARYKVKQDFLANPEKLIYVDDDKIKNEPEVEAETKKKPNFFKFLKQVYNDNKEYKEYRKKADKYQLKYSQALEKVELTPEQEKRAKQLQSNVFKMFNKVDEKSQLYSESAEAIGEVVQTVGGLLAMVPGAIGLAHSLKTNNKLMGALSAAGMLLPSILLDIIITKDQKSASKVANMLAIKELDDYKQFADYSDNTVSLPQNNGLNNQSLNKALVQPSAKMGLNEFKNLISNNAAGK